MLRSLLLALLTLNVPPCATAPFSPDYLNQTDVSATLARAQARLLTIAPHVGKYAADILAARGVSLAEQVRQFMTAL